MVAHPTVEVVRNVVHTAQAGVGIVEGIGVVTFVNVEKSCVT